MEKEQAEAKQKAADAAARVCSVADCAGHRRARSRIRAFCRQASRSFTRILHVVFILPCLEGMQLALCCGEGPCLTVNVGNTCSEVSSAGMRVELQVKPVDRFQPGRMTFEFERRWDSYSVRTDLKPAVCTAFTSPCHGRLTDDTSHSHARQRGLPRTRRNNDSKVRMFTVARVMYLP